MTYSSVYAQNYNSYFSGNSTNIVTTPKGGVCLMGGASEHDNAMRWFLEQADGGDVLVLRATGADGYNDYLLNQLGITINSVETIVFNDATASQENYIHQKIQQAEAIWFAGGDQWDYISYWRNTPIDSLINKGIAERKMVVGGTSAGMAIQGGYYFSAENGTVTSANALNNPFNAAVTVSNEPFLENEFLQDVITDTHYDNPDRKGRHVTFLSRILNDYQQIGKGIACEEYTAVCLDTNGLCKIFGEYPAYDEDIYFIQPNCELANPEAETCVISTPLTWNHGGQALKVYHAKGTLNGAQTFDLSDWESGTGGVWEHWYVVNGVLTQTSGTAPNCAINGISESLTNQVQIYPNPVIENEFFIEEYNGEKISLTDLQGKAQSFNQYGNKLEVSTLQNGTYILTIDDQNSVKKRKIVIAH
jgi:cyanophycinase-like exopeptidase